MKKYYYEFVYDVTIRRAFGQDRHFKAGYYVTWRKPNILPGMLVYKALRIWCESQGEIFYVKHHYPTGHVVPKIDIKEFTWIKLAAKKLEGGFE